MKGMLAALILALAIAGAWWQGWLSPWVPDSFSRAGSAVAKPVYEWTDAAGRKHFGDAPPAGASAAQAQLPELTVVTMPKAAPEKPKTDAAATPSQAQNVDENGKAIAQPSRHVRNPALERMGL